jgi:hypothetical protein
MGKKSYRNLPIEIDLFPRLQSIKNNLKCSVKSPTYSDVIDRLLLSDSLTSPPPKEMIRRTLNKRRGIF